MLLLPILVFLPIITTLFSIKSHAQENTGNTVEFILHKRIVRDVDYTEEDFQFHQNDGLEITANQKDTLLSQTEPLNGATFQMYELTDYYESQKGQLTSEEFVQNFAAMDRSTINELIASENLEKVGQPVTTAFDQVGNLGDGIARITQHAIPIVAVLPIVDPMDHTNELSQIHIYPKNVGYLRDPYFFKYGRQQGSQETGVPLQGVVFALYQLIEGKKYYLDMSPSTDLKNKWIEPQANDPLGDVNDKDGLVTTGGRLLPAGTYYFEELKSVDDYTITKENKKIEVVIPTSWQDADGQPNYVTVNGQEMAELESGNVPKVAYSEAKPRVYNEKTDKKTTEDSNKQANITPDKQEPKESTWLSYPKANETKSLISLIGIILIIGAGLKLKKERGEKNE